MLFLNYIFGAQPVNLGEDEFVREINALERAVEAARRAELDPPWEERDKWPSDCQLAAENDLEVMGYK